jgi:VWFA-related protein
MRCGLALLVSLSIATTAISQTRSDEPVVSVRQADGFPQIAVEFELRTKAGEPILDARKDQFRVEEYDAPVAITSFQSPISKEFRPTTIVLVLDTSGSMQRGDRIGGLKRAVDGFLENRPEGSRIAVIAFNDRPELICPFTDDPRRVRAAVSDLNAGGKTVFYDAVTVAIRLLSKETGRRAILAMTDGEDNLSLESDLQSTVRDARRAGFPVHTLGLGDEGETSTEKLRQLAEETRGRAFSARQADDLRSIFEEIARGLGQTYHLTYTTDHRLPDGTLRPIKVFYGENSTAGVGSVFVRGMVVPAPGWSWLFVMLMAILAILTILPTWKRS